MPWFPSHGPLSSKAPKGLTGANLQRTEGSSTPTDQCLCPLHGDPGKDEPRSSDARRLDVGDTRDTLADRAWPEPHRVSGGFRRTRAMAVVNRNIRTQVQSDEQGLSRM